MHFKLPRLLKVLPFLFPLACKDPESAAVQDRVQSAEAKLQEGRQLLATGQLARATEVLQQASGMLPGKSEPLLLLSEVHRRAGNPGGAILALKQAMTVNPAEASDIRRELAARYEDEGLLPEAIDVLLELREAGQMGDSDLLRLAHLQTRQGQHEAAFETLERIQRERPDDVPTKVVEAEILLAKGEELLAAKLMDRLLEAQPELTSARLLRARYFLKNGFAEYAEQDLAQIQGEDAARPEVLTLKAKVLTTLERHEEADRLLSGAVARHPRNAELLAWLAEAKLRLGHPTEARALVDKALGLRPSFARALYVRARVLEEQGDLRRAKEDYLFALTSNPAFAPALSRTWRLHRQAGEKQEALSTLERLLDLGEASLEEKVALAELYAQTLTRPERGLKLMGEALERDPANPHYLDIQKTLKKALPRKKKKKSGPIILRGGR